MNLIIYLVLLITSIFCTEKRNIARKTIKKVKKDILKIKITEDEQNYVITMRSKYYFPMHGTWFSEDKLIDSEFFDIEKIYVFDWIIDNVTDKSSLYKIFNNLEQHFFVLKISKKKFTMRKKKLSCCLDLLKKEDFQKIMIKYLNDIAVINLSDISALLYSYNEMLTKSMSKFKNFGIVYSNITDEMPDLNEYEVVLYGCNDAEEPCLILKFFKRCKSNIAQHKILLLGFFVIVIFFGKILLTKFFN